MICKTESSWHVLFSLSKQFKLNSFTVQYTGPSMMQPCTHQKKTCSHRLSNSNLTFKTSQSDANSERGSWNQGGCSLVFVQVVSFGDGKASVLQDLHFDFLRLLLGLLLQPLLLQNLFNGDLLQEGVAGLVHILQRQGTTFHLSNIMNNNNNNTQIWMCVVQTMSYYEPFCPVLVLLLSWCI